jgi:hypothetical protein
MQYFNAGSAEMCLFGLIPSNFSIDMLLVSLFEVFVI